MKKTDMLDKEKQVQKKLGIANVMASPKIKKIMVSMAVQEALKDKKNVEKMSLVLTQITGQKAKITKAKKSVAAFKLREGEPIGVTVTLRGNIMYDFLEKLIGVTLPRVRDFHGIPKKGFDGHGNYTLGFPEFTVFPEIDLGKIDRVQGLQVTIVTTSRNDEEGKALLETLGLPFEK